MIPGDSQTGESETLERAIAHMQSQRGVLGDAVVDAAIASMREKLAALRAHAVTEERKQVTILFADLVGFTAIAETIDPEEVGEVQAAFFKACREVVERHGGVVEKFIGDAVVAVYGVPSAKETDPSNAVLTGLELQTAVANLNRTWGWDANGGELALPMAGGGGSFHIPAPLRLRIGINTGLVAVTVPSGRPEDFAVAGDAVNTASRIQGAAPPGGVLITHATYRHVRGMFDMQVLEPIAVKGKRDTIQVYLVKAARPRAVRRLGRGVEGVEAPLIGRDRELDILQHELARVITGRPRAVTVLGEAGLGKTRLINEFADWVELLPHEVQIYRGRASQEQQHVPYALLRDLFAFHFRILETDDRDTVWTKMEDGFRAVVAHDDESAMRSHVVGQLVGFDFSDSPYVRGLTIDRIGDEGLQLRHRGVRYLIEFFNTAGAISPVVVLLEDIHWADESSLDTVHAILRQIASTDCAPVFTVCATRPSLVERRPGWTQDPAWAAVIELHPLKPEESGALIDAILRRARSVPDGLRSRIVQGAEGNPFYLEELVKMLIEEGVIRAGGDTWEIIDADLSTVRVPPTLGGVIQARLDGLSGAEREVLQRASVLGRAFWSDAVRFLSPEGDAGLESALAQLCRRELVYQRPSSTFASTDEFSFSHALLREVAYEGILLRTRRIYHGRAAEWLMRQGAGRSAEIAGPVAHHLELAGEAGRAVPYLRAAAEHAVQRYANAEASSYVQRALSLASDHDLGLRFSLIALRERIHEVQGARGKQDEDLRMLHALAEQLDDEAKRGQVALRRAQHATLVADFAGGVAAAEEAVRRFRTTGSEAGVAEALLALGRALWRRGHLDHATPRLEEAMALAARVGARRVEGDSHRNLGILSALAGHYDTAHAHFTSALEIYRGLGDRRAEGATLNNIGNVRRRLGMLDDALACHTEARDILRAIGDRRGESAALNSLAAIANHRGDCASGIAHLERALEICRELGDRGEEGLTLGNLGLVCLASGDHARAISHTEEYLRIAREVGDPLGESRALDAMGRIAHQQGDHESAARFLEQALAAASTTSDHALCSTIMTNQGQLFADMGHLQAAVELFERARDVRRQMGEQGLAAEPQALLAAALLGLGRHAEAIRHVDEILAGSAGVTLGSEEIPFEVGFACHQVLKAVGDPRAGEVLASVHSSLMKQAARITDDAARVAFLQGRRAHRAIAAEFAALTTDTLGTANGAGDPDDGTAAR